MTDAAPDRTARSVVFILDVDNTLLDNDGVKADMDADLRRILGESLAARFWEVYEQVRHERGLVDLPATFEAFRADTPDAATLERARSAIMDYPFANRVYPDTPGALRFMREHGEPVIVSDGDQVYQPRKIERSGLAAEVQGRWIVYVHKEDHLDEVMARWPAAYYVMVDDKARILAETKRLRPDRFVTVHVLQGHYASDAYTPAPDVTIRAIGDLRSLDIESLSGYLAGK